MALPKQVQAQLEQAEQIQQQLGTPAIVEDTPADPPPPEPPTEPPVAAAPVATPVPQEPADDVWRQRYETLRGKYDAETARLHDALRQNATAMQSLQTQMAQLQQRPTEAPKEPEKPLVTSQDDEKFGSDLIDAMRRAAREELRSLTGRLDKLETLAQTVMAKASKVDQVEQQVVQSREGQFWTELAHMVPDWEAINADQRWLEWLAEVDPIVGKARQVALQEAQAAFDVRRVAGIFKLFKDRVAPPQQTVNQAKAELARQVAPAKSSKTTVQPQGAKVYSGQEYHYWLDPRRVHDTDNATLQAMIAEVERALMENRIRW